MRKENIMELQYIVLGLLAVTGSSTSSFNCSTTKQSNPFVQVYDAADNVQNFSHNGTVLLQNPSSDEAIGWIGLECSHTKPIRWVYDFNFIEEGIGDSYSLTERKVNRNDFYNTSSYIFKAEVELKVYRPGRNFVLFCVTFENICERTVAHVYYDETRKLYVLKSLTKPEENNTLVRELEQAAVKRQNWLEKVNHNETCAVNFSVVDRDNNYIFSFFPNRTSYSSRPIPDRQNLENTYLFYEKLSPACFIPICENCTIYYGRNNSSHWPILFFDYKKNESLVVHAYFTLITRRANGSTSPGKLKLDWEKFDAQDMVLMELGTDRNPSSNKFYSGETLLINCYGSSYLFSFGTQIAYISSASNTDGKITFLDVKEKNLLKGLGRLGTGQIPLEWPNDGERYNITVYCFSPVWNSPTEWVNISETVEVYAPSLQVNGTNQLILLPTDLGIHNINFSCKATGNPAPEVRVIPPGNNSRIGIHKTVDGNTMIVDVSIVKVDETHVGVYNCVATNPSGVKFYEFELRSSISKSRKEKTDLLIIVLTSIFVPIITIFLAIVIILAVKVRIEKEEFRRLTEEAARDFMEGSLVEDTNVDSPEETHYANDNVKSLPYNDRYEIPQKNWDLGNTVLGTGNFGIVVKGSVEIGTRKSMIAIKTVKSPDDIVDFKTTLLELKIMAHIGHHHHIVKLIAASTENIHKRKILIGVEFCANGSLLSYMQKRKKLFTNNVEDGKMHLTSMPQSNENKLVDGLYDNLMVMTSDISTLDLYKWSFQIACGMNFLDSKKVLHADLATRNILLTDDLVVKISDFGLSRDLFENSEYTKKTQVALPWKWMAIESLKFLKFSTKSDVWSYGVTLYEVFTLGDDPYTGQTWTEEFVTLLENGMRLERPPFCTINTYNRVMMQCWQKEPAERITFGDAMSFFEKAIGLLTSSVRNDDECRELC